MGKKRSGDKGPRLTFQSFKVLNAFISDPSRELSGADLIAGARIAAGTLYPILLRFEEAGWLVGRWEKGDPSVKGRPLRKLYRISGTGLAKGAAVREDFLTAFAT
jgi:PadR family transcriptional regulator, regulatory protein PadR